MQASPEHKSISVALVYDDKELGRRLREVLIESGGRVVCELDADHLQADTKILAESGAEVVLVNLDPDLDEAIDQIMGMMDMDHQRLMINDAEASRSLDGWDQARWARHLAAKVFGRPDVDPPRPELAEPVQIQSAATTAIQNEPVTNSSLPKEVPEEVDLEKALPDSATDRPAQESLALNARMGAEIESMLAKETETESQVIEHETNPDTSRELDQLLDELAGHVENLDVATTDEPTPQQPTAAEATPADMGMPLDDAGEMSVPVRQSKPEAETNELDIWLAENLLDMPPVPEDELDDLPAQNQRLEEGSEQANLSAINVGSGPQDVLQAVQTECLEPLHEVAPLSGGEAGKQVVDRDISGDSVPSIESEFGSDPGQESLSLAESLDASNTVSELIVDEEQADTEPVAAEDSDIQWMLDEMLEEPVPEPASVKPSEAAIPSWDLVEDSQQATGDTDISISPSPLSAVEDEGTVDYLNPGLSGSTPAEFDGLELLPLGPRDVTPSLQQGQTGLESLAPRRVGVGQVIAIGASIGGPDALRSILGGLPANLAAVLVVVQHMDDAFFSNFIKQLKAVGTLSVQRAEEAMQVHHGEVLVVPPGQRLRLSRSGRVGLLPRADEDDYSPSIDDTFSSLATTFGMNLHALILSGMARDALRGAQTVKENGGIVWTQSSVTCVVSSMVDATLEAGLESFSGEPEALAQRLVAEIGVESRA